MAAVLTTHANSPLQVRAVRPEDEELILEWANDPDTRRNAFNPQPIPADVHTAWFRRRLEAADERFYLVETATAVPVGQVRFARVETEWEIHYTVAPAFRGRGIGRSLLAKTLEQFRADVPTCGKIFGRVKPDNIPSRRIFQSLSFEPGMDGEDKVLYRLSCA